MYKNIVPEQLHCMHSQSFITYELVFPDTKYRNRGIKVLTVVMKMVGGLYLKSHSGRGFESSSLTHEDTGDSDPLRSGHTVPGQRIQVEDFFFFVFCTHTTFAQLPHSLKCSL